MIKGFIKKRKFNDVDYILTKNKKSFLLKYIEEYKKQLKYNEKFSFCEVGKYERKWRYLKRKYKQIYVYGIEFVGIGETIPRLFMYLKDRKQRNKDTLYIVLPTFTQSYVGGIYNKKIFDVFGKHIYFITKDNLDFWCYVFFVHGSKINIESFDKYIYCEPIIFYLKEGQSLISFDSKMEAYAERKMKKMGIKGEYICLHAREVSTKLINFSNDYPNTSSSDVNINSFKLASEYAQKTGYQVVRMGKDESKKCDIDGVIDYANAFYDDFMDFYLLAHCKFLIGSPSGLTTNGSFWGRPYLLTNLNAFCYGFECRAITKYNMYLPKKFYLKSENRILNLYETLVVSNRCDRYDERFRKEGIELIDNTEEEILQAVVEMNEKLNNTWKQTEEEIKYMEKYWKIINLWKSRHKTCLTRKRYGGEGYQMVPMPICYSYLKNNLYLLDVKELI